MIRVIQALACFLIISSIPFSAMAGVETCVDPDDGGCFPTIQAAVDAASPSTTIEVRMKADGSPYNETVQVGTPGLIIQGQIPPFFDVADFDDLQNIDWLNQRVNCPLIDIDACETPALGDTCGLYDHPTATDDERSAFVVDAPNVTIRHFNIRHALHAIRFDGGADGGTAELNCFIRNKRAIYAGADGGPTVDNLVIQRNRMFGNASQLSVAQSVVVYGDNTLAQLNLLSLSNGFEMHGSTNTVSLNAVYLTTKDSAIEMQDGSGIVVSENVLTETEQEGVYFIGGVADSFITGNLVFNLADDQRGIEVSSSGSTGNTITGNTVRGITDDAIYIPSAMNNLIQGNTVSSAGNDASEACISAGPGGEVLNNNVSLCTNSGINVDNATQTISGNLVQWTGASGIELRQGNNITIHDNMLLNNQGEGFSQDAAVIDTVLTDNTATGNRTDICNDGTISTFTGNTFVTGGTTTPCVVKN